MKSPSEKEFNASPCRGSDVCIETVEMHSMLRNMALFTEEVTFQRTFYGRASLSIKQLCIIVVVVPRISAHEKSQKACKLEVHAICNQECHSTGISVLVSSPIPTSSSQTPHVELPHTMRTIIHKQSIVSTKTLPQNLSFMLRQTKMPIEKQRKRDRSW
jgi:hypothetical protein